MSDLFGMPFSDLLETSPSGDTLSTQASGLLELSQGTVFLWPEELIDAHDSNIVNGEVSYVARQLSKARRVKSRASDPLVDFFKHLLEPEVIKEGDIAPYQYVTRNAVLDRLINEGTLSNNQPNFLRSVASRIQSDLIEYNLIKLILRNAGSRPAIFLINYPFDVTLPEAIDDKPSRPVLDLSSHGTMVPMSEEERDQQLIELRRTVTHRGRPHSHLKDNGELLDLYERETMVRDPSGIMRKIQLTAESFSAVMTKRDDLVFSYVLSWCLYQVRQRKLLDRQLDGWYVLTPEEVMQLMDASRNDLDGIREMMLRWKDTRLTAASVSELTGEDDDGEFINFITKESVTQFGEVKEQWKTLRRSGREVLKAIAFTLPQTVQKELERRAEHDEEGELLIGGRLPQMIRASGNRSLLKDEFAMAVDKFFWTTAKRYSRTSSGWKAELWNGMAEMFDFEFVNPPDDLPPKKRRSLIDINKKQFMSYLERFFKAFSDDPSKDLKIFKGYSGGIITVTVLAFTVVIELLPRTRSQAQQGTVCIKPLKTTLPSPPQTKPSLTVDQKTGFDRLVAMGVAEGEAAKVAAATPTVLIEKVIELAVLKQSQEQITSTIAAFIVGTLRNAPTLESIQSSLDNVKRPNSISNDSRDRRRAVTNSVMDLKNTDW